MVELELSGTVAAMSISPHASTSDVVVPVRCLDPDVAPPTYAKEGDAGADLVTTVDVVLAPGQRAVVPTGVGVAIPNGFAGFVHPRSGLAAKQGVSIVNAPGTIDAGYRGEIKVVLINTDPDMSVHFTKGDRIAQLVIQPVVSAQFVPVDTLEESHRGTGGFGSSGR